MSLVSQPENDIIFSVDQSEHGSRIDQWVASQQPQFSRSYWSEQIKKGNVLLNHSTCLPKIKLKVGDIITIKPASFALCPQTTSQPQMMSLNVIYEDEHILVINKPAGLVVHPGAGNIENTLLNGLLAYHKEAENLPRAGIVHRLDKDTSGIMVVAKSLAAYHKLVQQLQERTIKREYIALVYGHLISGGHIVTEFGRHPKNRLKMAVVSSGKEAITHYAISKQYQYFTLLNVQLETGRTHQIRVHMAHLGHPLIGDPLYGQRLKLPPKHTEELKNYLRAFKRQALHAYRLTLLHPIDNQSLTWVAPIPDDLDSLIKAIEAYGDNSKA